MTDKRDVIRMKVPYPNIQSKLAYSAHMYICNSVDGTTHSFVKCQTLKPYMLSSRAFLHFVDEMPDLNRNPFMYPTRIDCDKLFTSQRVHYDDRMKTMRRTDVCQELFEDVSRELEQEGYTIICMDESALLSLNTLITQQDKE